MWLDSGLKPAGMTVEAFAVTVEAFAVTVEVLPYFEPCQMISFSLLFSRIQEERVNGGEARSARRAG